MNFKIKVNTMKPVLLAVLLVGTGLSANLANAQSSFRGAFTLQHETTWASVDLPAGSYVITLDRSTDVGPTIVLIRNAATGNAMGMVPSPIADSGADVADSLVTSTRGSHSVVQALRVAELGKVFVYGRASTHGRRSEEASNTEIVPVLQAKK
jgi:hypothetical protein